MSLPTSGAGGDLAAELLALSADPFAVLDASGRLRLATAAWREHLGFATDALVGAAFLDLVHEGDRALAEGAIARLAQGEARVTFEARCIDAGGRHRWFLWTAARTGDATLLVGRDVAAQKDFEALQGDFVATVSHELRTPLAAIRGALGLLVGGAVGELGEGAAELVGIADANAVRLADIVEGILTLERVATGRLEIRVEPIQASVVLAGAIASVERLADGAHVRVERDDVGVARSALRKPLDARAKEPTGFGADDRGQPRRPGSTLPITLRLRADLDGATLALGKLLSNAIKSSPRGAVVRVVTEVVEGCARISVIDLGQGIAPADVPRMFQPFARLEGGDARRGGGIGVGLALAKLLVEAQGGRVGLSSQLGRGSTFWIELPLDEVEDVATPPPAPRLGTALIADDDAAMRALLGRALEAEGMRVVEARDGAEAIHLARTLSPDVIVLDLHMPRPDGFEVVDVLRGEKAGQTPLVVYSSYEPSASDRARLSLGPTRILVKGALSTNELADAVLDLVKARVREATRRQQLEDALHELRAEYQAGLSPRIEKLAAARAALADGDASGFRGLREIAHALRGTAGSYGFAEMSRLAGTLEDLAGAGADAAPTLAASDALLAEMRAVATTAR